MNDTAGQLPREADFWTFVMERWAIYRRRSLEGRPPPWTQDPILATGHFTNVFRSLDPGTIFIRDYLARRMGHPLREKILNVTLYRFCLREEAFAALGWRAFRDFDGLRWGADLGALRDDWVAKGTGSPYHGAYYITNFGLRAPKHEALGLAAGRLHGGLRDAGAGPLLAPGDRATWLEAAVALPMVGPFIANQILADLTYDGHIQLPAEGYVFLSAGAQRGLRLVAGLEQGDSSLGPGGERAVFEGLHARQPAFGIGAPANFLTRMNLQNCLCEFSKYERARRVGGRGGLRRGFRPEEAWARANQGAFL